MMGDNITEEIISFPRGNLIFSPHNITSRHILFETSKKIRKFLFDLTNIGGANNIHVSNRGYIPFLAYLEKILIFSIFFCNENFNENPRYFTPGYVKLVLWFIYQGRRLRMVKFCFPISLWRDSKYHHPTLQYYVIAVSRNKGYVWWNFVSLFPYEGIQNIITLTL